MRDFYHKYLHWLYLLLGSILMSGEIAVYLLLFSWYKSGDILSDLGSSLAQQDPMYWAMQVLGLFGCIIVSCNIAAVYRKKQTDAGISNIDWLLIIISVIVLSFDIAMMQSLFPIMIMVISYVVFMAVIEYFDVKKERQDAKNGHTKWSKTN